MKRFIRDVIWLPSIAALLVLLVSCGDSSHADIRPKVEEYLKTGKLNAATIELKSYLAERPNSGQARYLLGTVLHRNGDLKDAEVEFRKALELKYPAKEVVPALARVLIDAGLHTKVVDEFAKTTLGDAHADADLLSSIGIAYSRSERNTLAAAAFARALALEPALPAAKLASARLKAALGDVPAGLALVAEVLSADAKSAEAWQTRGDILLYGQRNLDLALEAYGRAIEGNPSLTASHLARIQIYLFQRDVESTRRQYEALRKVAPGRLSTKLVEAELAYLDSDYARAKSLIQPLAQVLPNNIQILVLDGAINMQLKAYLQSESSFGKAVYLAPASVLPRKLLAQTHLLMGQPSTALTDLAPLLESAEVDSTALSLAAEAQLQGGNLIKADEYFRRAAALSPADVGVRTSAALARLARGETQYAFDELATIAGLDKGTIADLALISAFLRRANYESALNAIAKLAAKLPDKPLPPDLIGRIHLARNEKSAARASFERALELDPAYFPAATNLAQMDVAEKNVKSARQRYEAVLNKNPRNSDARMALIELKIFEKTPKPEVEKLLVNLIAADTAYMPARLKLVDLHLASHAPKAAVAVAQDAVTAFPAIPEYMNALGRAQTAAGELGQALSSFGKLTSLLPNRAAPILQMADVQVLQGNASGAMSTLRRALELAPGDPEINRRLMALAISAKQPERAIGFARDLQRRQPKSAVGYVFEAEIEAGRKNWLGAIAALRTGISSAPEHATPMAAKLYVAYDAADRPSEAEAFAAAWIKDHPKDASFQTRLAELLLMRKDWVGAEKYFQLVLKFEPESAGTLNNVAWLMLKQHKRGATAYSQRAVSLAPASLPILDTHAMALSDEGKSELAIEIAKQLVAKAPEANGFRLTLAKVYAKAGKAELAKPELEQLAKLGSKFSEFAEVNQLLASLGGR